MRPHAFRIDVGWDGCGEEDENGSVGQRVGRRNNQRGGWCEKFQSDDWTWSTSIRLFSFWLKIFSCVSFNVTCRTLQLMVVWWISHGIVMPGRCVRHQPIRPIRNGTISVGCCCWCDIDASLGWVTQTLARSFPWPSPPLHPTKFRDPSGGIEINYQILIKTDYLLGSKFGFHGNVTASSILWGGSVGDLWSLGRWKNKK